jgi:hypothetical protein
MPDPQDTKSGRLGADGRRAHRCAEAKAPAGFAGKLV